MKVHNILQKQFLYLVWQISKSSHSNEHFSTKYDYTDLVFDTQINANNVVPRDLETFKVPHETRPSRGAS